MNNIPPEDPVIVLPEGEDGENYDWQNKIADLELQVNMLRAEVAKSNPNTMFNILSGTINALLNDVKNLKSDQDSNQPMQVDDWDLTHEVGGPTRNTAIDYAWGAHVVDSTITIQPGPIFIQGNQRIDYAGGTITATGSYCIPTVTIPIINPTGYTITGLAALPTPDSTNVYFPLARFKDISDGAGTKYAPDGKGHILHRGAIQLINPLVLG